MKIYLLSLVLAASAFAQAKTTLEDMKNPIQFKFRIPFVMQQASDNTNILTNLVVLEQKKDLDLMLEQNPDVYKGLLLDYTPGAALVLKNKIFDFRYGCLIQKQKKESAKEIISSKYQNGRSWRIQFESHSVSSEKPVMSLGEIRFFKAIDQFTLTGDNGDQMKMDCNSTCSIYKIPFVNRVVDNCTAVLPENTIEILENLGVSVP